MVAAVEAGADAVGFVFARSRRQVTHDQAAELAVRVPFPVARVGVFVDAPLWEIVETAERCRLSAVQLCGSESPSLCARLPLPVIKVLHVDADFDWAAAEPYRESVAGILLDTMAPGFAGGTAKAFDWSAVPVPPDWVRVTVAGGLRPDNVAAAVRCLRPFAVDVSSGVESEPGVKDAALMQAFCGAVERADEEAGE